MIRRVLQLAGIASIVASIMIAPTQVALGSPASAHVVTYVQDAMPRLSAPKPPAPPAPKAPTVGRNVQPPKVASRNGVSGGRNVQAPGGTGNKVPAATSGRVTIPKTARASGSSYTDGGHTYTYSRTTYRSYYVTYHGGYPFYGTALYWQLLNDPFYLPNYGNVLSPWYGHMYPAGYMVSNGQLVATSSPASAFWTVFWIFLIITLIGTVFWIALRRRSSRSSRNTGHFGGDI